MKFRKKTYFPLKIEMSQMERLINMKCVQHLGCRKFMEIQAPREFVQSTPLGFLKSPSLCLECYVIQRISCSPAVMFNAFPFLAKSRK